MNHAQKVLNELISSLEGGTYLAESRQVLSLDVIERFGITDKEPDCSVGREFVEPMQIGGCLHFRLLEDIHVAIDGWLRSRVSLFFDFPVEHDAPALPLLPALENRGSKLIKATLPLAPLFGFRERPSC